MRRPATHRALIRCLQGLGSALTSAIRNPNYGGCGVIAGVVGTELERLGIECDVATPTGGYSDAEPANCVRAKLNHNEGASPMHWDSNGLSRSHLALRFVSDGRLYSWDTDGVRQGASRFGDERRYKTDPRIGTGLTIPECVTLSEDRCGWNSSFDRSQIPAIRELVRKYLGQLECAPAT